ncbi:S-adenosyl-L-methionine-dependent methyltransferase [Calocera cornea HHB12733]|uniref:S-adenosyl-L-methionine-dependent methyltransferase n=1 Tax=Calocera cornea HHB12733 TaxID=1353952 RepID=A0A165I628_9BASI|nr:S-adenosyl-L-methionine-dependent methyltransferase [Calocera cornea HHB12733]
MAMITITSAIPDIHEKRGRYYTAETYLLPSDDAEKARLNGQHEAVKPFSDGLIPAGLVLKAGDAVLDAGTGSGIWLLDIANRVAEGVSFTGMDIEGRLFPKPLPNMKFLVGSTFDLPHDLDSTFTLVHQRLMVAAFSVDGWRKAISGFYRVLKPGGYIKLEEIDFLCILPGPVAVPPLTSKFCEGSKVLCAKRDVGADTLLNITALLEEAGFEMVDETRRAIHLGGQVNHARDAFIGAWRSMKGPFVQSRVIDGAHTDMEYDDFLDQIEQEWRTTDFARTWCNWTARKP